MPVVPARPITPVDVADGWGIYMPVGRFISAAETRLSPSLS